MGVIADLIRAGVDPDLIERVHEQITVTKRDVTRVTEAMSGAERTRRWREKRDAERDETRDVTPSPEKKNPTPHKKITTPSPSDPKGSSVETPKPPSDPKTILAAVLSEETVVDLIAHRKAIKAPITAGAAKGLARDFAAFGDAEAAARTMMARGWRGFKPEWMQDARAGPPERRNAHLAAIQRRHENERSHDDFHRPGQQAPHHGQPRLPDHRRDQESASPRPPGQDLFGGGGHAQRYDPREDGGQASGAVIELVSSARW